ncbi:MAG: RloB domain-containing protein [Clostridiales bacterium]|nr:RloB domain-containing protein [Clostridiales bacterium]
MISKRREPKGKKINPHFWVFCEGKTEEAYIRYLRSVYRLPIEIIPKVSGSSISSSYITRCKQGKPKHKKDRDFLVYDADVPEVMDRLKRITSAILIASNPAIELWFLLHYKNQAIFISENECIEQLSKRNRNTYKKGQIDGMLQEKLREKYKEACARAKYLTLFDNPSTNFHIFIEILEDVKKNKL